MISSPLDERERSIIHQEKSQMTNLLTWLLFGLALASFVFIGQHPIALWISLFGSVGVFLIWVAFSIRTLRSLQPAGQSVPRTPFPHGSFLASSLFFLVIGYGWLPWAWAMLMFLLPAWWLGHRIWKRPGLTWQVRLGYTIALALLGPLGVLWTLVFLFMDQPLGRFWKHVGEVLVTFLSFFIGLLVLIVVFRAFFYEPIVVMSDALAPQFVKGDYAVFEKTLRARRGLSIGSGVFFTDQSGRRVGRVAGQDIQNVTLTSGEQIPIEWIRGVLDVTLTRRVRHWSTAQPR